MKNTPLTALLATAALTAAASTAGAQCFVDDNLSGPCFAPTTANIPALPPIDMPGLGICWDNCNVSAENCLDVSMAPPIQLDCDTWSVDLKATDCAGISLMNGGVVLDYTRTWMEMGATPNTQYQVWRFAAKVEFKQADPTMTPVCPAADCLTAYDEAFYYGYVDYARECFTGAWESAVVLFHGCDAYQHDPLFSSKPGVFHPGTTYALVAPHTTANPFIPTAITAGGGAMLGEATRIAAGPAPSTCKTEERIAQGTIAPIGGGCTCTFALAPAQVTARHMEGFGLCGAPVGSSFQSINTFPSFPWLEVITTSMGRWSTTASYPGPEIAWVDEGVFLYDDASIPAADPSLYAGLWYGGSTDEGFFHMDDPFGGFSSQEMTDLASNVVFLVGTPIPLPLVGDVVDTRYLIYTYTD